MSVAGAAGAMIFAIGEDTRRRREQAQDVLPAWHSWLDNWPELKKIQDDWFEAFPPTKERSRGRPQDEAPKHL